LFVLEKLAEAPSQSLNDLAARTFTHQSSVSTVVARLVEQGLVSRQHAAGDSRKLELVLTARGRRMAAQTTGAAQERLIASIERVPARSRRLLATLLAEIVGHMDVTERRPPMFFDDDRKRRLSPHV
jgi:DNA-binding MarR family transcriptional regulator